MCISRVHLQRKVLQTHRLADIKADNILVEIDDKSILKAFVEAEMRDPSPRKFIQDTTVYGSRRFARPRQFGQAVLSDYGSAVRGDERRNHDAQPNVYRSPEVMLETDWSYPADIWNVGVMVRFAELLHFTLHCPICSPASLD